MFRSGNRIPERCEGYVNEEIIADYEAFETEHLAERPTASIGKYVIAHEDV